MLAAEREKEEGGWPGGGGIIVFLLASEKLGHLEIVLYACMCCLTRHVCDVSSLSQHH